MKFIKGSALSTEISKSQRLTAWKDVWAAGKKIRMFIPIFQDEEGNYELGLVGQYGHSLSGNITKQLKRIWIPSTMERDEFNVIIDNQELDIPAKLSRAAYAAKLVAREEEIKRAEKDPNYVTQAERDQAIVAIKKRYDGENSDNGAFKAGVSPVVASSKLRNSLVCITCELDDLDEIKDNTLHIVQYNPSNKKVGELNSALDAKVRAYNKLTTKLKEENPDAAIPENSIKFLEVDFHYDTTGDKNQLGQTPPKEPGYKNWFIGNLSARNVEVENKLAPWLSKLPKTYEEVYAMDNQYVPMDSKKLLQVFKMIAPVNAHGLNLLEEASDKEYIEKHLDVLKDIYPSLKDYVVEGTDNSEQNKALSKEEQIKYESDESIAATDNDTEDGPSSLDELVI